MNGWALLMFFLLVAALAAAAWRAGRRAEKTRLLEEQTDDLLEAADIRDRLRRDADFAERLRARFTR
jgi:hypothetical protein